MEIDDGLDGLVAPVGGLFNVENIKSEKPDPVVAVFCVLSNAPEAFGTAGKPLVVSSMVVFLNENDEATLAIFPFPSSPALPKAPNAFAPPNDPVC